MEEPKYLSGDDVRAMLADACARAGGMSNFAERHKISASYISKSLTQKQGIGPKILKALRLKAELRYVVDPSKPVVAGRSRQRRNPPAQQPDNQSDHSQKA